MAREEKETNFMNRWGVWLVWLVILVGIPVGGYALRQMQIEWEMNRVLESQEVAEKINDWGKFFDKQAFTENGLIKEYRIDNQSARLNPMGGIMVDVIINRDKELVMHLIITKNSSKDGYGGTATLSKKLQELVER